MESISNPLPIYIGLLLILVGVLAMYAGVKDRRTAIAVSGFLFLVAGAGRRGFREVGDLVTGMWIIAGTPATDPYPCQCEKVDADPPAWKRERARRTGDATVYICDPYVSKKGYNVGRWTNRCACWGQPRDGKPDGCCANHEGNPRHVELGPDGRPLAAPMLVDTIPPDREAGWQAPHERVERPIEDVEAATAYADALGIPLDVEPTPYVRRWTREELHCDCRTPWDHMITKEGKVAEKGIGYHCAACHNNFRNSAVAGMHQRDIMLPCRPPASIVDFETGARILRAREVDGHIVWG